ncbi:hypothetical protein niasHT_017875 [Heterodera trifolii]|uniref:Uncharacterized protein n=1 Tax=Heterodera trifolii TaxID=157864 RepID=A0ABD2LFC4_9BILA
MNSKNDDVPIAKCVLLSMLPKPKREGGNGGKMLPAKKLLPISITTVQPKQTTGKQSWKNKSAKRIGNEETDDDSSGAEESPTRPTKEQPFGEQNAQKQIAKSVAQITLNRPLGIDYGDSDSSEDEANDSKETDGEKDSRAKDFFGLLSTSPVEKRAKMDDQFDAEPQLFIEDVEPGPSRPPNHQIVGMGRAEGNEGPIKNVRAISDEQAHRLIYERELAPFGANPMIAQDAVSQMLDVSVDNALGPNVRENLLKNLSGKQLAQLPLAPLPKMKKSDSDKLAKRKHQITHLATVAVSREEQLKDKWADSKQTKKMSRQKLGHFARPFITPIGLLPSRRSALKSVVGLKVGAALLALPTAHIWGASGG